MLDHDVPVSCRRALEAAGHDAWTVGEAGRPRARDDDQTAYAIEMRAVLITLDREFTTRRRRNAIGRHVRLKCAEPDAAALLTRHLGDMLPILEHNPDVTIVCQPKEMRLFWDWKSP